MIVKMKDRVGTFSLLITGLYLIFTCSCKKEKSITLPELSTKPFSTITSSSVVTGGSVTSDGGSLILSRGVCWSENVDPTISDNYTSDGKGGGTFFSSIKGLTSGTGYYVRAYATNIAGTSYGNEFIFITPLTDIDGNVYNTVKIGDQVWMTQNLKTTRFYDNIRIPQVADNSAWANLTTPGWCWYANDEFGNGPVYGALYNWFAVSTDKLCPNGWHVPSEKEWIILSYYLGGDSIASGKLKEVGADHWSTPNAGASNEFGFTALPGGYRTGLVAGSFRTKKYYGWWWTATETDEIGARARLLTYDASEIAAGSGLKKNGYSVRCVKDNYQGKK
jgi:uncharacterized protein (TIGR02145 family)